jgi:hypothetical protein
VTKEKHYCNENVNVKEMHIFAAALVVNGLLGQLASIVVPNVGFFFRKKMSKVIL